MGRFNNAVKRVKATPVGKISIANINTELSTAGKRALGQADGRTLAGKPTGKISLSDYKGKANTESEDVIMNGTSVSDDSKTVSVSITYDKVVSFEIISGNLVTSNKQQKNGMKTRNAATIEVYALTNGGGKNVLGSGNRAPDAGLTVTPAPKVFYTGTGTDTVSVTYTYYSGAHIWGSGIYDNYINWQATLTSTFKLRVVYIKGTKQITEDIDL